MKTQAGRCTGNSTRLIDEAIQTLFTKGVVIVQDHVHKYQCHKQLYEMVLRRLKLEHSRDQFTTTPREFKIEYAE